MKYTKIAIFTLIFCVVLIALIAICMWAFSGTSTETTLGLSFRPKPINKEDVTLLWFKIQDKNNIQMWENSTSQFLNQYYTPAKIDKGNSRLKRCSYFENPGPDEVCDVDVRDWGECSKANGYGYQRGSPCIFLMLNKINGFRYEYYDHSDDLPRDMPVELQQRIQDTTENRNVWLSCAGQNPADVENIGTISYHPFQGFPGYYFPYLNTEGYLSPLVAVKFERPATGVVINVECRAWAKNIPYSRANGTGYVTFQLLID